MGLPTFIQTLVTGDVNNSHLNTAAIKYHIVPEASLLERDVDGFLDKNNGQPLGISPNYNDRTKSIYSLAIVGGNLCFVIQFGRREVQLRTNKETNGEDAAEKRHLVQKLLDHPPGVFAFDLGPLAMSLYNDLDLRIQNGVDIQSVDFQTPDDSESNVNRPRPPPDRKNPLDAIIACLGDSGVTVNESNVKAAFKDLFAKTDQSRPDINMMQRAWISQFLPTFENGPQTFDNVPRINLDKLPKGYLDFLAKLAVDSFRLDSLKPLETKHSIALPGSGSPGPAHMHVHAQVYKNKFRTGTDLTVAMTDSTTGAVYYVPSHAVDVQGREATITANKMSNRSVITSIASVGRDGPTRADQGRSDLILRALQGRHKFSDNPWINNIWFPPTDGLFSWPESWSKDETTKALSEESSSKLNPSQATAVEHMLSSSNDHRFVLIQGPPGTGKTSVIAQFVLNSIASGATGIWLVAQSNVAVKNIAEKLLAVKFMNWKLLVSQDFHFDWHEHLYNQVKSNLIRSDGFKFVSPRDLSGCRVILCTLSMLSHSRIKKTFTRHIPLNTLVVDEASQIEIGDYFSVFLGFENTLRKVCFIGDDKQLPPFGQEDLKNLQSIFEVEHLRTHIDFLDTQYRMPPQIGDFISEHVYDGLLKSNPLHPVTDKFLACRLLNVDGKEEGEGLSWKNTAEAKAILQIARHFQDSGHRFKIITPYDGQRNCIENLMKEEELDWEDKCFNVDSFQGNEDDYIVVSLVRSGRSMGFLKNLRRTNVMLSRCRRGMLVVSSKAFLQGGGAESLAGKLKKNLEDRMADRAWLSKEELHNGRFWEK